MKKLLIFISLMLIGIAAFAQQTRPKISQFELAPGEFYTVITDASGIQTYQLAKNDSIASFEIVGDSLCISTVNSYTGAALETLCVSMLDPDPSLYVDTTFTFTGSNLDPGLTTPVVPTYWEVFRNGVRQNFGATGDWDLVAGNIVWALPCDNDLIIVRYPE